MKQSGAKVTRFKPGDEVFGGAGGAFAEYVVARETASIIPKPPQMTFEEAAAIPIAAITALQALRDQGRIAAGQKVLINGASGGVGTYAVQIAKAFGAEVTGVCSTRNVEMVRSLGADHVIDYTEREPSPRSAKQYDLIIDNVGNHPLNDLRNVMTPEGTLVVVGGSKTEPFLGPMWRVINMKMLAHFIDQRFTFFIASVNPADLTLLADLVREGKMRTVIDRRYPLEETGAALDYIGSGRARGKVVITVALKRRYNSDTDPGVAGLFVVAIAALVITMSYESPCPSAPPPAPDGNPMRAVMQRCYGAPKVLTLERIAKPAPTDGEILIKVRAAGLNPYEWHMTTGKPYLLRLFKGLGAPDRPRVGSDFAGIVESVGRGVTRFKPGDEVFGGAGGALAEYVVAKEDGDIVAKPADLTFEQAAAIPIAAVTALQALRDHGRIAARQRVLDQWRLGRRRHLRRAAGQVFRRGSDRRLQHAQRGARALARRGSRHRLHAGQLHQRLRALRPHLRHRGQSRVARVARRADAEGHAGRNRRIQERTVDRTAPAAWPSEK